MSEVMRKERSGVAGGLILIGIGVLLITGWWWPGIMVVIGVALAAERWLSGSTREAHPGAGHLPGHPVWRSPC